MLRNKHETKEKTLRKEYHRRVGLRSGATLLLRKGSVFLGGMYSTKEQTLAAIRDGHRGARKCKCSFCRQGRAKKNEAKTVQDEC